MEYEVRVGIKMPRSVQSNIGYKMYSNIMKVLTECTSLEHRQDVYTDTYFSKDVRQNGLTNCVETKQKIFQQDEIFGRYNLRFCKSEEKLINNVNQSAYTKKYIRKKIRDTFVYKNQWKFDVTKIENTNSFELEIEALDTLQKFHSEDYIRRILMNEMKNLLKSADV